MAKPRAAKRPASRAVQIILFLVLGVLVAVLVYLLYDLLAPRETLAVLAFTVPQRSTPELEGVIKGVREKTLAALRASPALRRSGFQASPAGVALGGKSPTDIGRELGARLILAGDVTFDGTDGAAKIQLSLIDTMLSKTLWSKTYLPDRESDSTLSSQQWQDGIAQDAVKKVLETLEKK